MADPAFHLMPNGTRIAYRHAPGRDPHGPTIVFLPGYRSDMAGGKACAVLDWAAREGHGCLLFDYSGCGLSQGDFAEGTLSRWRDEALALIAALNLPRVVLVGSSMGGWLMLLLGAALGWGRVAGLLGIAAAPDFTQWGFGARQKAVLAAGEIWLEDNAYGPEPTPTYPGFHHDAERHLLLAAPIAYDGPARLVHGMADGDVPHDISLRLARALRSARVQITLVKDGDHRLSRPADIALILAQLAALVHDDERKPA